MPKRPPTDPGRLRLGLVLPTWTTDDVRWTDVLDVARAGAAAGFDALYATDHFLLPSSNAELKRRSGADVPDVADDGFEGYLECFTVLSALATAIPGLRLGTLVACAGYRNTGLLAKIAATLDGVSGGRLVLGLGSGDAESEHRALGLPFERPVTRFEEALRILRSLFAGETVTLHSGLHELEGFSLIPPTPRPGGPPIMIGTLNPKARMQRLVVEYADVWNGWLANTDSTPESAAVQLHTIDEACAERGRDPLSLEATTAVRVLIDGSDYPVRSDERPLMGSPAEMAEALRGHAALGITEVQIALTLGGVAGVEAFAPVIAALRG